MSEQERCPWKLPLSEPDYENDTGPNDESFWEWWEIEGVGKFNSQKEADYARLAINYHDDLIAACESLAAKEWAGHNATCICCRRTSSQGHTTECEWIKARAAIVKAKGQP